MVARGVWLRFNQCVDELEAYCLALSESLSFFSLPLSTMWISSFRLYDFCPLQ